MRIKHQAILHAAFWSAFWIWVWDLYETILEAGDTPYRLHHGWWAALLVALCFVALTWDFYWFILRGKIQRSIIRLRA